jgi:hypothetical protein
MADSKELLGQVFQDLARVQSTEVVFSVRKRVRFNPKKAAGHPLLQQLGREITGGDPPLVVSPRSLGPLVMDTGDLRFDDSTPINMNGNLTFFPNGNWNFFAHMHNSGGLPMNGQMVIAVAFHGITTPDPLVGIKISGSMGGVFGDRNFDRTDSGNHPPLVDLMSRANDYDWQIDYGANVDLEGLVSDVKSTLGTVAELVALVA